MERNAGSPAAGKDREAGGARRILAPQDAAGGVFLLVLGGIALWGAGKLSWGTLGAMGPGMLPKGLAVLTVLCGAGLLIGSFFAEGEGLERWHLRGPLCVLGAAIAFSLAIRPLGLLVAAPLAVIIAGLASRETRWVETMVFAAVMTVFCLGLFRYALGLPMPVAPWLINY